MKQKFAAWLIVASVFPHAVWAATPPQDQAKLAEAKAKSAWMDKVAAYQLCESQDDVAATYREQLAAAGKPAPQPVTTPSCNDPGPFVFEPDDPTQPLEGSGAHSPAETAKESPSSATPDAANKPLAK